MPIPKPKNNESKDDFIERCMGDDVMNSEYPDNDQRFGICQTQWKEKKQMSKEKEVRQFNIPAKVEKREDGSIGNIYGYPIVYNRDSEDMGFIERIAPGAAKKALERSDIRGLKNHDPSLIFARQGVNLTFSEDKDGLKYEATPIDTRNYREIAEEIRSGLLTGQSFGFTVLKDEWSDLDSDHPKRTITEIGEIFDVGPVTYPAYPDTRVALRSLENAKKTVEEPKEEKITLTIDNEKFDFIGENRFDEAAEKIKSLRSSKKDQTIPDDDNPEGGQRTKEPDGEDETLEKLKKFTEKLRNEDD